MRDPEQFAEEMVLEEGETLVKRHIRLNDPQELIDMLSPTGPLYRRQDRQDLNWIFRGQSDANWNLAPSAHRDDRAFGRYKFTPEIGWPTAPLSSEERATEEFKLIVGFADGAERAGHELPGDTPLLRDADAPEVQLRCSQFPPLSWRWMAALAQHSGVPTRLLDWTYGFLTASFFAAREPARLIRLVGQTTEGKERTEKLDELNSRYFAVWALSRAFVSGFRVQQDPSVILVTAPTVSNPNLQRQQGLFTLVRYASEPAAWCDIPSLDELFGCLKKQDIPDGLPPCHALYQFVLPWSCSGRLLQILNGYGVNALQLFEGLGVSEAHLQDKAAYTYP